MKFYEINKILSFALMGISTAAIGLWIALMVLHFVNNQNININSNQLFSQAYNECQTNFTNIAYGGLPYAINGAQATPEYGNLLVQNHQNYQFISIILLFASGPSEIIALVLSFFLLLKSRVPYKSQWYLGKLDGLKAGIYVFSWLGLITAAVYFGYTLTFFLKLGTQNCTASGLRDYANGYFINVIIGAIMAGFTLINYLTSIGVRKEPAHLDEKLFQNQQESKMVLQPLQEDRQMQRKIAQELQNLPKINNPPPVIQMTTYPPEQFKNYNSQEGEKEQMIQRPPIQQIKVPRTYNLASYGPIQSRFIQPTQSINSAPANYFYVPQANEPLGVSQIDINIDDQYRQPTYNHQRNDTQHKLMGTQYNSPTKSYNYNYNRKNQNSASPGQKSQLKIFNRGANGSKEKSIINDLRSRYGRE